MSPAKYIKNVFCGGFERQDYSKKQNRNGHIYIYIYTQRERKREREREIKLNAWEQNSKLRPAFMEAGFRLEFGVLLPSI